ncbi:MAG: hypothetical protein LWX83_10265 [Anaerolineae bacterium]|nr:hypothetical protein [Anaerolineae bacterium]
MLVVAAGWKLLLIGMGAFPFNADEAVVGLMARHITAGEWPIFFYGQAYMGSLDAIFIAGLFSFLGQSVNLIRFVQIILYLFTIITTLEIGRVGFNSLRVGLNAAWLLSIPAVNQTLYTTVSLGGYGETLLLGNLLILISLRTIRIINQDGNKKKLYAFQAGLGILSGLGVWINGLSLVFSIPAVILVVGNLVVHQKKDKFLWVSILCLLTGGVLGALPWWIYASQNGIQNLIGELSGSAVNVAQNAWLLQTSIRLMNFFLLGLTAFLGIRPPWEIRWLVLPLIPFVIILWGGLIVYNLRNKDDNTRKKFINYLLAGIVLVLFAGFVFTPFGNDPSGRYLVVLLVPAALFISNNLTLMNLRNWQKIAVLLLLIVFQGVGTWQCALNNPPGITTQFDAITVVNHQYDEELIRFLEEKNERFGYTNYWVSYPLAFLSQERIIFLARLPYHPDFRYTRRDDRYEPYRLLVKDAPKAAYITSNHPQLNNYLRKSFKGKNITWMEKQIGNYTVFYGLSEKINPEDIGLGETMGPMTEVKNE